MPITRKHFELGIDMTTAEWMRKTYDYLAQHKDEAFTTEELGQALGLLTLPGGLLIDEGAGVFSDALDKLAELEAAEKRLIRGTAYYSLGPMPLQI